ncbi:MAG: ABC transporter ATP-binding protein [Clostridiales bacterium]|nr:ABC transporter ATP-binding protein [Clostridiales bacterium]
MTEAIRIEELTKIYGMGVQQVLALDKVSLTVNRGEFVAIIGASGSGKSTFMNVVGCLDRATSGEYFLEGINIKDKTDDELSHIRNRYVGFVLQSSNLVSRTSAFRNIELPMIYSKIPKAEREERTRKILIEVGLSDRGHHMPNELSGGQKQRVAIARAMANDPSLLLADEPTGNLDSKTSLEIMDIFTRLNKEKGATILLVTHERSIAECADRIITFHDGKIAGDERTKGKGGNS